MTKVMTTAKVIFCSNQEKIYTLIYEYLNALIDANWARLIVNTNFHFGRRGSPLSFWPGEHQRREVFTPPEASTALLLGSDPRQWIVSSQPAVLRPTKARQAQRKCATAAHSLRRYPHHPPPHPIANPCALLEAQPCSALLRGDNNRRKRRSGGQRGPRGVAGRGGGGRQLGVGPPQPCILYGIFLEDFSFLISKIMEFDHI